MATKVLKPNGILFHRIEINPTIIRSTTPSFQERFYQPQDYFIEKNQHTGEYHLLNKALSSSLINKETPEYSIYAFVILEKEDHLILEIGNCNHHVIAKRALSVAAAGDIYVLNDNKKIFKITDQAGSYHIQANDSLAAEKSASAKIAMKAFDLPLHLFVPFKFKPFMFQPSSEKDTSTASSSQKLEIF